MMGNNHLCTPNEPNGICVYYYLKDSLENAPAFEILNSEGEPVREMSGSNMSGIHKVRWDTGESEPGEYQVIMSTGNEKLKTPAKVLERWKWPVGSINTLKTER
jgi:hypothetical protein